MNPTGSQRRSNYFAAYSPTSTYLSIDIQYQAHIAPRGTLSASITHEKAETEEERTFTCLTYDNFHVGPPQSS